VTRPNLWLLALILVSAGGLVWLIEFGSTLPERSQFIEMRAVELFPGERDGPPAASAVGVAVELPHDWRDQGAPVRGQEAWYRFRLPLNVPPDRLWGVLLPGIEQNAEVFLNGELVGRRGTMGATPSRYVNEGLYFVLPNGLLRPGENRFDLRVRTYPAGHGYLDTVLLGPDEVLGPVHDRQRLVGSQLLWLCAAASLAMALVAGALAWQRPGEPVYGWLALQTLVWALRTVLSLLVDVPLPGPWWFALSALLGTWFCACSFMFGLRLAALSLPRLERVVLGAAALATLLVLGLLRLRPELVVTAAPAAGLVQMALGPVVLYFIVRRYIETRDPELFLLLYAAGIIMIFGAFSMAIATGVRSGVGGRYLIYATPLILGAFVMLLLRRFVQALGESEQLTATLERKVEEKSAALEANYRRLSVLEQERALARERERIMRDMHDGVGGHLVASLARLRSLELEDDGVRQTLEQALTDLRLMIDSLDTEEGDLNVALGMLRQRLKPQLEAVGLAVHWHMDELPPMPGLTAHGVLQVLRILQEAVTNVLKHAGASRLEISGQVVGGSCVLSVADDGRGFDGAVNGGRGLGNMTRRAAGVGARLDVDSDGSGTRVCLRLPASLAAGA